MNFIPTPIRNVCAVLGALAIQTLCLPWTSALAAPPPITGTVTVVNDPASPVPVSGTVNVNPGPQVLNPYQVTKSVNTGTCYYAPQCIITFPTVPNGKRLVITNVSAQLGLDQDGFVIDDGSNRIDRPTFFIPKTYPTASNIAAPVTIYFEPTTTPTARFFVPSAGGGQSNITLIVTFVGYLVPVQ